MKNKNFMIVALVLVIAAVGGFFAGMKYQQGRRSGFMGQNNQRQIQGGQGLRQGGFRPVSGEIISADGESVTVKLSDGSSKIVILSAATEVNKAATGTKEDLKIGEKVMVIGQENSDGSITAQNIQLNPGLIRQGQ